MGIPKEYDEAAIIEGAGYFTIWWRIILPLSKAALGVVAIMFLHLSLNVFQAPLIYLNDTIQSSHFRSACPCSVRPLAARPGTCTWRRRLS